MEQLILITMLYKTKRVFTTYLPVLCSIASKNDSNRKVEVVETFNTIYTANEMEITMKHIFFNDFFLFNTYKFNKYHHHNKRNGAPYHYIVLMKKGNCKLVSENHTIEIKEGEVFYIPMHLVYQSYWHSNTEIVFKSFGFKFFPESDENKYCLQKVPCDMNAKMLLDTIKTNSKPTTAMLGDLYNALALLLPVMKHQEANSSEIIFQKAKEYITNNPHCSVKDIARHCGISETTLYTSFKKAANKTPTMIRNEFLCNEAVLLLITTNKSVQEISDSLGFSSTSYFRKVLQAYIGLTPREIRKKYSAS